MKYVINGRFLERTLTGVDRFALELVLAIDDILDSETHDPLLEFELIVPGSVDVSIKLKRIKVRKAGFGKGYFWEQFQLPFFVGDDGFLINFCNLAPVFFKNQIVVIHDIATIKFPDSFGFLFKLVYRFFNRAILWSGAHIFTVSEFSKGEICEYYGVDKNSIRVIGESGEHILKSIENSRVVQDNNLTDKPFFLCVGSLAPHKNFQRVIKVIDRLPSGCNLIVAGGVNESVFKKNIGTDLSARVKFVGRVSDGELLALYKTAYGFIFPSIYEGFGIPPLEAMECGCPVIASNAASIPEVCGEAALYFDPDSSEDLLVKITKFLNDNDLRKKLIEAGVERVKSYTWKMSAQDFLRQLVVVQNLR